MPGINVLCVVDGISLVASGTPEQVCTNLIKASRRLADGLDALRLPRAQLKCQILAPSRVKESVSAAVVPLGFVLAGAGRELGLDLSYGGRRRTVVRDARLVAAFKRAAVAVRLGLKGRPQ